MQEVKLLNLLVKNILLWYGSLLDSKIAFNEENYIDDINLEEVPSESDFEVEISDTYWKY